MSSRRKKIKSSSKRRKPHAKLNWSEEDRNINTLRKIEKANQEEKNKL